MTSPTPRERASIEEKLVKLSALVESDELLVAAVTKILSQQIVAELKGLLEKKRLYGDYHEPNDWAVRVDVIEERIKYWEGK